MQEAELTGGSANNNMTITLTISLLPDGDSRLSGFAQFWLRYVHGFSPHFHCQKSLRGFNDPRFRRDMEIGISFELLEPGHYDYIYLCGVAARRYPGLHLVLAPEPSASAHALTYNGIEIAVVGAQQLAVRGEMLWAAGNEAGAAERVGGGRRG